MFTDWVRHAGGIQGAATAVGDMLAGQTQSSGQTKGDAANASLNDFSNGEFLEHIFSIRWDGGVVS